MKTVLSKNAPVYSSKDLVGGPQITLKNDIAKGGLPGTGGVEEGKGVGASREVKDVYQVASGQTLQCGSLQALVQLQESGKLDQVRKNGAKNLGLLKGLMDDLIKTYQDNGSTGVVGAKNLWVGDIEGRENNGLKALIDAGAMTCDADGNNAKLTDKNARLIFQGDIGDRGAVGIWARRVLTSLKKANPAAVDIIWGNRCLSKLGLLNDLEAMRNLTDKGYVAHLKKQAGGDASQAALKAANTAAAQVDYWLGSHGARGELKNHQQELQKMTGKPVPLEEAAKNYIDSLKPGGEFFEYLKLGNWGVSPERLQAPVIAWHGGASDASIRGVPGASKVPTSAKEYVRDWMKMGTHIFAELEQSLKATGKVPLSILSLADSDWDEKARHNGFKASSNTYGKRDKEHGNYRGVSKGVAAFYAKDGVAFEPVGHSPVPMPLPMKSSDVGGVTRIYNDTSFLSDGSVFFTANVGDLFVMAGRLGDEKTGELVMWTVRPDERSPIGTVTNDGFTVGGLTLEGQYHLTKYVDGHVVANKQVRPEELLKLEPKAISLDESEEANKGRDAWYDALNRAGVALHNSSSLENVIGDKRAFVVSAASAYGSLPVTPSETRALWASLLKAFPDEAFLTGGTNVQKSLQMPDGSATMVKAPEYVFHEDAERRQATMIGFIPEQTNTTNIAPQLGNLFVAGKKGEWDAPLVTAIDVAGSHKGAVIFMGGGNSITRAIEEAAKKPTTPVVLVVSRDLETKVKAKMAGQDVTAMGASDAVAIDMLAHGALPSNFLLVKPGDDLGAMLKRKLGR